MRPTERSHTIKIPVTFDLQRHQFGLSSGRFFAAILVLAGWLLLAVLIWFTKWAWYTKVLFDVISFFLVELLVRFGIVQERRFMQTFRRLKENGFALPFSIFWNIYDIVKGPVPICRYRGGLNALFVRFEKGVIVGRPRDAEFRHYEALTQAYRLLHRYGISYLHLDYMDAVGKDTRVDTLLSDATQIENPELRSLMLRIFDGVKLGMSKSFTSYDVYVFFFRGKDTIFLDRLDAILNAFLEANFSSYTLLDSAGLSELFGVLTSVPDFSVQDVNEALLSNSGMRYLVPIWYEDDLPDGKVHREILNLTREERQEQVGVSKAEVAVRRSRASRSSKKRLKELGDIELGAPDSGASGAVVGGSDSVSSVSDFEIKL